MKLPKETQDRGYAWVILVVTLLYNLIEASVFMCPSVYLIAWDNAFDSTKARLGAVGSLMASMGCVSSKQTGGKCCFFHHDVMAVDLAQVSSLVTLWQSSVADRHLCAELSFAHPVCWQPRSRLTSRGCLCRSGS